MTSVTKPKIQILIGSIRPNRTGPKIAKWAHDKLSQSVKDVKFELVDIKDYNLPLLDEPELPAMGNYTKPHTIKWSNKIKQADGYILVMPEYNHGYSAATKNALDFLYSEWNKKPIAFIGYGAMGGVRAVEQIRQVVVQLQMIGILKSIHVMNPHRYIKDNEFSPDKDIDDRLLDIASELTSWINQLTR